MREVNYFLSIIDILNQRIYSNPNSVKQLQTFIDSVIAAGKKGEKVIALVLSLRALEYKLRHFRVELSRLKENCK